jgi:hypothetical protein
MRGVQSCALRRPLRASEVSRSSALSRSASPSPLRASKGDLLAALHTLRALTGDGESHALRRVVARAGNGQRRSAPLPEIRTRYGPTPLQGPQPSPFPLVNGVSSLYHQRTRNLLAGMASRDAVSPPGVSHAPASPALPARSERHPCENLGSSRSAGERVGRIDCVTSHHPERRCKSHLRSSETDTTASPQVSRTWWTTSRRTSPARLRSSGDIDLADPTRSWCGPVQSQVGSHGGTCRGRSRDRPTAHRGAGVVARPARDRRDLAQQRQKPGDVTRGFRRSAAPRAGYPARRR